jgi:hypothetical protein
MTLRRCGLILPLLLISSFAARGDWTLTLDGRGALFDLAMTPDGHVLAVGATNHTHAPTTEGDVLLMKLTLEGDILWERTWGADAYEQAWGIAPAAEGGYYVFGETASFGAGDRDFFVLRIDELGDEIWMRTYGGPDREWPQGMVPLSDGGLLLFGSTVDEADQSERPYAVRVAASGEPAWEFSPEHGDGGLVGGAAETSDGDLVLAVSDGDDGGLVKLDAGGELLWTRTFELDGREYPSAILPLDGETLLLAGFYSGAASAGGADVWLARCSSEGELQAEATFGDRRSDDYAVSLLRLADGTILLGGFGDGMPLWVLDADGTVLRESRPAGVGAYGAFGLLELQDGEVIVTGLRVVGRTGEALALRMRP